VCTRRRAEPANGRMPARRPGCRRGFNAVHAPGQSQVWQSSTLRDQDPFEECCVFSTTWSQVRVSVHVSRSAGSGRREEVRIALIRWICPSLRGGGGQQSEQWVVREPAMLQREALQSGCRDLNAASLVVALLLIIQFHER
jgi:hypothetical protein